MKRKSKIGLWTVAAIAAAAIGIGAWGVSIARAKWTGAEPVRVNVPTGATEEAIADSLRSKLGGAFGSDVFRLWQWQGGKPQVAEGSYLVEPGTTALALSRRLKQGRQTPVRLTFNNMRTMEQLAQRVGEVLETTPEDFLAACDSVLPPMGFKKAEYIAAFLPDTYEFYWNASAPAVVKKLNATRSDFWSTERREKAKQLGLTPVQAATLASIVEEETAKADERPKVARLYLNRIDKGMPLQADPTVKYAVGDFGLRRILSKHLKTESPYNTYLHPGLPPGPIRMATRQGIEAVLSAPQHPYLYMCAKEDFSGYHNFASDYATHQANARRYQAKLNRRGIK